MIGISTDTKPPATSANLQQPASSATQQHANLRASAQRRYLRAEKALADALNGTVMDVPLSLIEQRYSATKQQWSELQIAHDNYIIMGLQNAEEATRVAEDAIIDNFAHTFSNIEIRVHRKIRDMTAVESPKPTVASSPKPFIKLESMKFPIFDGNVRRYPTFKTEFERYIKPFCSAEQLPMIIKQYLSDSVRRDVENLDEAADIWRRLDGKFGSMQKIIDAIMHEIANISVKDGDDASTLQLIRTIENAYSDLKKLNLEAEMDNSTTITHIEKHMPRKMLHEWVKIAANLRPQQKFAHLLPFMEKWKLRVEYLASEIRSGPQNSSTAAIAVVKNRCLIHKNEEHPIWRCRLYQSLPVQERIDIANSHGACLSCLQVDHATAECKRSFKCPEPGCNQTHNQLLHL